MATVSKSFTENSSMMGSKATWTVTLTGTDQTVSGDFTLTFPTTTAKYVGSDKGRAWCNVDVLVKCGSSSTTQSFNMYPTNGDYTSWASNTVKTLPIIRYDYDNRNITLSNIFKSSNKTERAVSVTAQIWQFYAQSDNSSNTNPNEYWGGYDYISYGQIATVTLNAPPTVTCGTPTYSTPQYAGLGTYSVPITTASAQYGGDITSVTLTVGSDSVTQTYSSATVTDQTISLIPSVAGTYTPTITVTDSRQQTTVTNFPQITVNAYTAPSMNFDLARCDSSGVPQAEGEYGLVTANISYVDAIAKLTQPTVSVKDESDNTIISSTTWYTTWNATNGVSNAVNWTNYNPTSPVTLYGVVSATGSVFSPNESYTVSITPTDNMGGTASTITQTLATGFFTIDFKAGGKEIAFGSPANDTLTQAQEQIGLFKCTMDTEFNTMTSQEVQSFVNSLNYSGINSADYIVEQGTDGDSTYRKWNSGIAECWISTTQNVALNNAYGSLYQGVWTWTFPFVFSSAPTVTCSQLKWGTGASWGTLAEATTAHALLRGIDVISRASGSCTISAYAIGKWK